MTVYIGGWAVSDTGVVQTTVLADGAAVPSTAVFFGGIAHAQDGTVYITTWPTSAGVAYRGKFAVRADGALITAPGGTIAEYERGFGLTYRGEVVTTTDAPTVFRGGFGTTATGALSVSASAGSATLPSFTAPVNQEIVTANVEYAVSVYAPSDTAVTLYDGATEIGAMTDAGGGTFTYAWTPSATPDYDINLNVIGNVSGQSASIKVVAAEANTIDQNITTWSKSNASITITGGQADPDGGTSAYLVTGYEATNTQMRINKASSGTPTEFNNGFEVWAKPNGYNVLMIYPLEDGGNHYCYIDLTTGQTAGTAYYCKIVERKEDGWVRIWTNMANAATAGQKNIYFYFCNAFLDNSPDTTAGQGMYLYQPRSTNGVLPFTQYQKMQVYKASEASGVEIWEYRHPFIRSAADTESAVVRRTIEVIKPTGWSAAGSYRNLHLLPALGKGVEDYMAAVASADYATTYSCVIAAPRFAEASGSVQWYGQKNDGTDDQHAFVAEVMPGFMEEFLAGASGRENHFLCGYSKSANGAYSLILRNPTVFGYAAGWDGAWVINWASENVSLGLNTAFGTEAQWQLYDPYQILTSNLAAVNDKTRLVLHGYETFQSDQVDMKALLDANGIGCDYNAADTNNHSYAGGWLPGALAALFGLAA